MSEFGYGFGDGCLGFLGVDFLDGREEVGFVERVAVVTGDVGAVEAGVAEALDEFEDGVFEVGFGEGHSLCCFLHVGLGGELWGNGVEIFICDGHDVAGIAYVFNAFAK